MDEEQSGASQKIKKNEGIRKNEKQGNKKDICNPSKLKIEKKKTEEQFSIVVEKSILSDLES